MTDKQIIIDGVDVSGWTDEEVYWKFKHHTPTAIRKITFDLYKQLSRKEQECERLKEEIEIKSCANIELSLEFKKYKKAIDEIEEIADNNYEIPEMHQIFLIIGGLDV